MKPLNQHELSIFWGGQFAPVYPGQFAPESGGQFQPGKVVSLLRNRWSLYSVFSIYGAFEPAVQKYSCRGSVYWMGKAFLALLLPKTNVFWDAIENEGEWEQENASKGLKNAFLQRSTIMITNFYNMGITEIRIPCHVPVVGADEPFRGSENYNRLSYNSEFPWQADGLNGEVAMNYVVKNQHSEWEAARLFTFQKFEEGIYYRSVVMETNNNLGLSLADIPIANGILRLDRNISKDRASFRLGHYALPKIGKKIRKTFRQIDGYRVAIIDNGKYQLAMVPISGWTTIEISDTNGLHPESDSSTIINVSSEYDPQMQSECLYITLMLWKKSGERWRKSELSPIDSIKRSDSKTSTIYFKNGDKRVVQHNI